MPGIPDQPPPSVSQEHIEVAKALIAEYESAVRREIESVNSSNINFGEMDPDEFEAKIMQPQRDVREKFKDVVLYCRKHNIPVTFKVASAKMEFVNSPDENWQPFNSSEKKEVNPSSLFNPDVDHPIGEQ